MYFVLSGDKYPVIVQSCKSERQQKSQFKKRKESGVWERVEMVTGDYKLPELNTWDACDNEIKEAQA